MTKLSANDFVHLHNHTQYSLLDGLTKFGPLLAFVKDNHMSAVAKTDHGSLFGTIEFYKEAKANGIKPIIGMEAYVAPRQHTDKDPTQDKSRFHLIILAMNMVGYRNLMKLSTVANLDGFYYVPRIDHDLLVKYNEGLIILSACMGGEVGSAIRNNQINQAEAVINWYRQVFGDRYYLEVQDHGHPKHPQFNAQQKLVNEQIIKLADKLAVPVVVTCDAHYLKPEDQEAHEVLLCVGTGSYLKETKRMSLKEFPLYVAEPAKIIQRWGDDHPDFITNTKAIADRCNLEIDLGKIMIPEFPVPPSETEKSYLDQLVYQGLAMRYGGVKASLAAKLSVKEAKNFLSPAILERATYELAVIDHMNFNGYFLIIWDFIKWGKDQGIVFGPGRGSAAGSIIAYALKITELDPLKYDLLFERFLNPDRISMPDIDIDIQDSRRDEVIAYCIAKYGKDRVANIITFGRMAARAAIRDVGRVLQVPYNDVDRLAKMIPPPAQGRHTPLSQTIHDNGELKTEYDNNPVSHQIIDMAIRLEGTARSHGVHAAGVVIAPDDIVKFVPLVMAQKGVVTTQYSMGPIEELGLLKMDFLGLSNLTTIKNSLRIIKKVYGQALDVDQLPLNDKKTYKLLCQADTTGVFQLESAGMKRYLRQLKPSVFEDIIAMVALYRPGPMQFIDEFIARKNGKKAVNYLHPKMKNALEHTKGVLIYQEQVMQISKDLCGFSGGQADTLRKAIGKKNIDMLAKMKADFIDGAIKHSQADRALMEQLWGQLEEFASYCFNKSHAACYAMIAYWTAYLKANFPAAFMAALMTSDFDDTDRLAIEIAECKRMGIEVLLPDVNQSFHEFSVVPNQDKNMKVIRFGMDAIKNVGHGAVAEIINSRETAGEFVSLTDFASRVNSRLVNRKVWESLIKSGALNRFGDRGALLESLDTILARGLKLSRDQRNGQTGLFDDTTTNLSMATEIEVAQPTGIYTEREYLQWERELLGLYLSKHPLEAYSQYLSRQATNLKDIKAENDGKTVKVGGIIKGIRQITTKNNQPMAFIKLEDVMGDEIELVVFPAVFQKSAELWQLEQIIIVQGKINGVDRNNLLMSEAKLLVDTASVITMDEVQASESTAPTATTKTANQQSVTTKETSSKARLYIRMQDTNDAEILQKLKVILDQHQGSYDAVLVIGSRRQIIKLPQPVNHDPALIKSLKALLGAEQIKFA